MPSRTIALVMLLASLPACTAEKKAGPGSGSSVALLNAYVDAWNRHDAKALDSLLTSDALHEDLAQGVQARGPEAVKSFMADLVSLEPDFKWTLTKVMETDSMIAAEWTWTGTYTGPGPSGPVKNVHTSGRGASVVEVSGGRIRRFTDYYDNASFFPKADSSARK